MSKNGGNVMLEAGDLLVVPKHVFHTAEVVGDEAVVSLDAVRVGSMGERPSGLVT